VPPVLAPPEISLGVIEDDVTDLRPKTRCFVQSFSWIASSHRSS